MKKMDFARSGRTNIYLIDRLRYRFRRDFARETVHFSRIRIYFVYGGFQLSNPVGYRYLQYNYTGKY